MSADIAPYLIKDSRINEIKPVVPYSVYSGAAQNTYQTFNATSSSTSQISFNVSVPSENTILDRNVLIQATYKFTIALTGATKVGDVLMKYGFTDAFQAFPLNSSITSINATINNTSVSVNTQDVLPMLLKMIHPRELAKYQGTTPTYVDSMGFTGSGGFMKPDYTTQVSENFNPLGSMHNTTHDGIIPRGAFPLASIVVANSKGGGDVNKLTIITDGNTISAEITAVLTEPLFLSPFIFGGLNEGTNQGFVGLNTLNLNINIDTSLKRFWSKFPELAAGSAGVFSITLNSITDAKLMLNFLTTQVTDMVQAKNVIPFTDYPRYITGVTNSSTIAKNGGTNTIKSQNIQLNQIPDLFLIALRKPLNTQTITDPNIFLPIRNISVNFNNASGLLSSASQIQLWEMSHANGVHQTWLEWSGRANSYFSTLDTTAITDVSQLMRLTAGSLLAINPAKDLSLPPNLSNGCIGQFNFQIDVTGINYTSADIIPELVIIPVNSGVFTTIAGSSSITTGLLTSQIVATIASSSGSSLSSSKNHRLIGGAMSAGVASAMKSNPIVSNAISATKGSGMRKLDDYV
jgi:hypothetical protein